MKRIALLLVMFVAGCAPAQRLAMPATAPCYSTHYMDGAEVIDCPGTSAVAGRAWR